MSESLCTLQIQAQNDLVLDQTFAPVSIDRTSGISPEIFKAQTLTVGLSRMTLAQDDDSTTTRAYNSLSSVTAEMQQLSGSPGLNVAAVYDAVGNQNRLIYPSGRTIIRTFDELNRPVIVQEAPITGIANYYYIGPTRVEERVYANSTATAFSYDGIAGAVNLPGDFGVKRLSNLAHSDPQGQFIDNRNYYCDRDANLTLFEDLSLPASRVYSYDEVNRLTNSVFVALVGTGQTNQYNLDGNGNRRSVSSNGVLGNYTCDATLSEPADCDVNQYTATPFDKRRYDRNE